MESLKPPARPLGPTTRRRKQQLAALSDGEDSASSCRHTSSAKRARRCSGQPDLCLYVRLIGEEGGCKVVRLPLERVGGVDQLRGLFRRLIQGAFAGGPLPDYLTSPLFYKFSPCEEFLALPGDVARTQFRLVATLDGWEYTLVERELGILPDPERTLLVTVAEFESDSLVVGGQEVVFSLVSYPTVCVKRTFLDQALRDLPHAICAAA